MEAFMILGLLYFICLDSRMLKGIDRALFLRIFAIPSGIGMVMIALALGSICHEHRVELLTFLAFFTFFPIYLIRRRQFFKVIDPQIKQLFELPGVSRYLYAADALHIIFIWIWAETLLMMSFKGLLALFPSGESRLGELVATTVISILIVLYFIYRVIQRYPQENFRSFTALHWGRQSYWKVIVFPAFSGLVFALVSSWVILSRKTDPQTPLSEVVNATQSSTLLMAFLAIAVLIAPLIEEIIFRGYFYRVISFVKGTTAAMVIITLSFALLHIGQYWGDWPAIAMVGLLGLFMTYLRFSTGSTLAGVVTHYVYNAGITLLPVIFMFLANPEYFHYQAFYPRLDVPAKEALLLKSIQRNPEIPDAYNDLAWLYAEGNKNLNQALQLINQALDHDPDNAAYLDTKAEVLFKSGNIAEAAALERELIKRNPEEGYYQLQLEKFLKEYKE